MGSGDEIIHPSHTPHEGQIRDINTYALSALFQQHGAQTVALGIAKDDADALFEMAQAGIAHADMLVITAGSSIGTRDHTYSTIQKLGMPGVLQHGLAVKPGKPTLIGVCQGKPVIGLPGNPVSAMLGGASVDLACDSLSAWRTPHCTRHASCTPHAERCFIHRTRRYRARRGDSNPNRLCR
ncbi:MAG UNVERIFIED_CONTAM: hypothetical protein LVT10_22695 [Anaerolineae bacterium]